MNILAYVHLQNIYGSTGLGRVARQAIEHLAQEPEDQLHILANSSDHRSVVHKAGKPWTGFPYHFFDDKTSRQQTRWVFTGRPTAEHYCPEAEVVYCPDESYVPTVKARLVVTLHDVAIFEAGALPQNWRFFKQRLKSNWLYHILSRKADLLHTVSNFSADRIAHFFPGITSRLRVVHNAAPPRFFLPISDEGENFLREQGIANRPFILLPGGLNYRKNAELVLKAWPLIHEKHPELILVVVSHCEPTFIGPAKCLGESVRLMGYISDDALCSLYHAACLVWFPSLYEGFGLPILEAMACGTPVVASDSTSIPEVAGNAAVLVSPRCVTDHVEAIDSLLKDGRQREDLSRRGKLHAQQFTWQHTAAQLRRQFLSLV
jgi:glycosyltransferase involved in cell wall biosynthesis